MAIPDWRLGGHEPDYRFSLANERTFLAWVRTALAILAGAVLLHEFAFKTQSRPIVFAGCVALPVLCAFLSLVAYNRWKCNEIAMRHSKPLPHSYVTAVLAFATFSLSVAVVYLISL